jgi:putative heme-binding domain-containing protein
VVGVRPAQGTFETAGASLVCPGDPYRSVVFYRMSKLGRGRMPHIGAEIPDERGLRLIHDWIGRLTKQGNPPTVRKEEDALVERLFSAKGTATDEAIGRLLSSTSGALHLTQALADGRVPSNVRGPILTAALARPEPHIRDLFERFVPDEQRVKRLGTVIKPEQILSLKGDAARGKALFLQASGTQCVNCHRVNGTGSTIGPDLSQIGKKYDRTQLLESILEPSKRVDPPYVAHLLETADGQIHTGILVEKNNKEVVLRCAGDKEVRVPAKKVAALAPQKNSLMPDLLLRDLTAEQVADLLEFLASLN